MSKKPQPTGDFHTEPAFVRPGTVVRTEVPRIEVKPYGYLRELRIVFDAPILNVDANHPLIFLFERIDANAHHHLPFTVFQICESVA